FFLHYSSSFSPLRCHLVSLHSLFSTLSFFFFFNDTSTPEIYTLSLHDALPISFSVLFDRVPSLAKARTALFADRRRRPNAIVVRSEEHTSELQSRFDLVCRLLLEKKNKIKKYITLYYKELCSMIKLY